MADLTAEHLRKYLQYDPETGIFIHLIVARGNQTRIGDRAGGMNNQGYWYTRIDGRSYPAHRLAWLYMTGEWPTDQIDHINGDRADNRFINLREANNAQNQANTRARGKSGTKGAYRNCLRWEAAITKEGKRQYLGLYKTREEAHAAYLRAAIQSFGEYAKIK